MLAGDFNFNLFEIDNRAGVSTFVDSLFSLGLVPTITKPTRDINNAMSLLDNIYISNTVPYESGLLFWDVSDHFPVFVFLQDVFSNSNGSDIIKFRLINDNTLDNMANALSSNSFDDVLDCPNPAEAVE